MEIFVKLMINAIPIFVRVEFVKLISLKRPTVWQTKTALQANIAIS